MHADLFKFISILTDFQPATYKLLEVVRLTKKSGYITCSVAIGLVYYLIYSGVCTNKFYPGGGEGVVVSHPTFSFKTPTIKYND